MSESKGNTDPNWVDPDVDPDEAPEWPDEVWDRAEIAVGGKVIRPAAGSLTRAFTLEEIRARRGRPPLGQAAKVQQSLRLSREVLDHFRATGPGWQARIDEVLRRHAQKAATRADQGVADEQDGFRGEEEDE
ncbi:MAG TPA: BrnA antitoxin family protein [Allosphingosinicella sp.]|nr:BrnA antitoxin family protein [Allosphingosinicella sp.]